MVRVAISLIPKRIAGLGAQRAEDRFRSQRQFREPHADCIIYGIRNGCCPAEGCELAYTLAAEAPIRLPGLNRLALHRRDVVNAGNLVVCKRGVAYLATIEMHLLE